MMTCPRCRGDGRVLNPMVVYEKSAYSIQIYNPDRLPLLVRCTVCGGAGRVPKSPPSPEPLPV